MSSARPEDDSLLITDLHVEATYRLTEALVAAENQMRRRVELLREVVFETDAGGSIVYLNNAWRQATGHELAACLGRQLSDFIVADDWAALEAPVAGPGPTESAALPLIRLRRLDGEIAWMELSLARIEGGGAVGALHDVTQQKLAQSEVEKLSLVASYTDSLVVITDAQGRTEWVNDAFTQRTGFTLADLEGVKPGDVLQGPDTDQEVVARIGAMLREGRSFEAEVANYTKTGEQYMVQLHITPIFDADGNVDRFVAIQTDSTELHRTRRELEAARERAEAANEAKTLFLATVSHEMRTPLNAVLGFTDLALDEGVQSPVLRSHLSHVSESAEILLRLITNILDVSKIEAGQIDVERIPVEIKPCVQDAIGPVSELAKAKGIAFELLWDDSLPLYVLGDPDRTRQIVTNLAENAVKFIDRGYVRVEIARVSRAEGGGEAVEIRVVDSGPGISEADVPHVFDRFTQGDSSKTGRKAGAGLGLSIVKSLVEALGGTISLRSRPGEGADFRVTLPLTPAAAPADARAAHSHLAPRSTVGTARRAARILVAEDNDPNYTVLDAYLTKAGYAVERALDGEQALAAAPRCDLILMDVEMPGMDGLEATRRIRSDERDRGVQPVPVIALTAHALQEYRDLCLSAGCTGYLSKPVRMHGLLEAVGTALTSR